MKTLVLSFITALVAVGFTACNSIVMPYATNVAVKSGEAKHAQSVCRWILGFRVNGCSADDAIRKGEITQVQTINIDHFNIWFYASQTISVRGK